METWTVVKFLSDFSVAAVPTKWLINDNECLWPPFTADKLSAAIKNQTFNSCWPTYKIDIFRNATYETYDQARAKSKKAEQTSDLDTTDAEMSHSIKKRKIYKKKNYSSTSDEDLSDEPTKALPLPPPPTLPKQIKKKASGLEDGASKEAMIGKEIEQTNYKVIQAEQNKTHHSNKLVYLNRNTKLMPNATEGNSGGLSGTNSCSCCPQHAEQNREVLRQLYFIRSVTTEILSEVKELKQTEKEKHSLNTIAEESFLKKFKFPLENENDLSMLNAYLKETDNFSSAELEMCKIGGSNIYDFVRRSMGLLVSNSLATNYSWLGRREKKSFNKFEISQLIIGSAKMGTYSKADKETEEAIQAWLKRAPERMKRDQKTNS